MANGDRFEKLQTQTLLLLWSVSVVNGLEIVVYFGRSYIMGTPADFWIQFGLVFHLIWSICAMLVSGLGVYGIKKHIPYLLAHTDLYFLCSASFKAFFTVLLLFFFPASGDGLGMSITCASSGPILLTLMERFFKNYQSLPIAVAHIITIAFVLYVTFLVKRYQNAIQRNINLEADEQELDGIRT